MEFKELIEKRRSIRKFSERAVPREVVDRILHETLSAPSARNTRTTHLVVVDDPALVARMADMRDYGSAFMKGARWRSSCWAIPRKATCGGRTPRSRRPSCNWRVSTKDWLRAGCTSTAARAAGRAGGETAAGYLRSFLPIPADCQPLCAVAAGYSDFTPPRCPGRTTMRDHPPGVRTDTGTDEKGSSRRGFLFHLNQRSCACEACRVPVF